MKCQVLLCGTNYGQTYLPAIYQSKGFELAAILANGSDHSIKLAEQAGVELYRRLADINEPIGLACVAIGGQAGNEIAQALLTKGIPVLIEHPQAAEPMRTLLDTAVRQQSYCQINSHFADLPPIVEFIQLAKKLNSQSQPQIISIACNSRTLFSMLDILMRSFGELAFNNFHMHHLSADFSYRQCSFDVQGALCQLLYQGWRGEKDDSKDSPLGHQLTVTYPEGVLCLAGTFGPCLWFPLLAGGLPPATPLFSAVLHNQWYAPTLQDMLNWRRLANHTALTTLYQTAYENTPCPPPQSYDYLLRLCRDWDRLIAELGSVTVPTKISQLDNKVFTAQSIYQNL